MASYDLSGKCRWSLGNAFSAETIPGGYSGATFRLAMRDQIVICFQNVVAVIRKYAFVWGINYAFFHDIIILYKIR